MEIYRYAQIDLETGKVISDSFLSGEVTADNMIRIDPDFDLVGKMYQNGAWVPYTEPAPEPIPDPTQTRLDELDETLAEILLLLVGGDENV